MRAFIFIFASLLGLSGCTQLVKEAKDIKHSLQRAEYETIEEWRDLLTYNPKVQEPQLAQRRYCYKQLTDIVCYDSPQETTSPITGIQEGAPGRLIGGKIAYDTSIQREQNYFRNSHNAETAPLDHVDISPSFESSDAGLNIAPLANNPHRQEGADNCAIAASPFACGESHHAQQQADAHKKSP